MATKKKTEVEEGAEAVELEAYEVEFGGKTYDLRGFTECRIFQVEDRENPRIRHQRCTLIGAGRPYDVPVKDYAEAVEFQKLTGPYFGNVHQ